MARPQLTTIASDLRRLAGGGRSDDEELLGVFIRERDQRAFAALVRRHAGLVMGVCRRALGHEQDAEDAFQATFLVLARNAGAIRKGETLASWLHGVAHRIACNVRRDLARRRAREVKGARPEVVRDEEMSWREVRALLDEEVQRLPEVYRVVFVLCCMQERTRAEAARLLDVKEGTVSSRLAKAKQLLQARLARRGVALAAVLGVVESVSVAAVTAAAGGVASARVVELARGVGWVVGIGKWRAASALVVFVGVLLAPLAVLPGLKGDAQEKWNPRNDKQEREGALAREMMDVEGRVVTPDGKPLAGANVTARVSSPRRHDGGTAAATTTDAAGRFHLRYRNLEFDRVTVVASAAGFGATWETPGDKPLTLKLAMAQPITGKFVDLEGRPVKNARLRILSIAAPTERSLAKQMQRYDEMGMYPFAAIEGHMLPAALQSAVSDAKGELRLDGLGLDWRVTAVITGETIACTEVWVMTTTEAVPTRHHKPTYLANFTHLAEPTRPVVGVVRDRATKKPIAGATVSSEWLANQPKAGSRHVVSKTDEAGRFRLVGLSKGKGNVLVVEPPADQPYLGLHVEAPDPFADTPVSMGVELPRGVWAEGRITEKETGKPVKRAFVEYHARAGNPSVKGNLYSPRTRASDGGRYRLPVLPGEGVILAESSFDDYLTLAEQVVASELPKLARGFIGVNENLHHALARIDPPKDSAGHRCDIIVMKGETLRVKLIDTEGKPVVGASSHGTVDRHAWHGPVKGDEFTVPKFNRKKPRWVGFFHPERNLVGVMEAPKDNRNEVVVRMTTGCTLTGQVVDKKRKPMAGVRIGVGIEFEPQAPWPAGRAVETDENGQFRVPALYPGVPFSVAMYSPRWILGSYKAGAGEVKNLGRLLPPDR